MCREKEDVKGRKIKGIKRRKEGKQTIIMTAMKIFKPKQKAERKHARKLKDPSP